MSISKEKLQSLGKVVSYTDQYDKTQLEPIDRSERREGYKNEMKGVDIWTAFEVSFLLSNNRPVFKVLRITADAESPYIFESKSLKLYLNSFNNTKFESVNEALDTIKQDLTDISGLEVQVEVINKFSDKYPFNEVFDLDTLELDKIDTFEYSPELLRVVNKPGEAVFTSNLLRSNCEITNQPDWGRIFIKYKGNLSIDEKSLLKYIVSYRNHQEFHEPTCERIYEDLFNALKPEELTVICQYTRRGGIDINPIRSNIDVSNLTLPKLLQQ